MRMIWALAALAVVGAATLPAQAQQFPTKPVTIIVPFAAGGATDLGARALADGLSARWKQNVVIENKPGAGTMLGMSMVAKAAPDGYTLGTFTNSFLTNPAVRSNIPYDTFKDLTGVGMMLMTPTSVGVHPSFPATTLAELIAESKKASTPIAYASTGLASGGHMAAELLQRRGGFKWKHVPYNGMVQAIPDLISGRIPIVVGTFTDIKPYVEAKQLRVIVALGSEKLADSPQTPLARDTFPGFNNRGYTGIVAPSGVPKDLIAKISADIADVVRSPDYVARLKSVGQIPWVATPEETNKFWREEVDEMTKIAKEEGIKLD